jgi:peroxiredoxin
MLCIIGGLAGIDGCKRKVTVTPEDGAVPQTGRRAPDFTLPAATGENVSLDQFLGKSTIVLVFYRGYW